MAVEGVRLQRCEGGGGVGWGSGGVTRSISPTIWRVSAHPTQGVTTVYSVLGTQIFSVLQRF